MKIIFRIQKDVDLGFRLRLQGLRCFYVPKAVVHHVGSAGLTNFSDFAIYHGHRNLVWTYLKNMPAQLFWVFLPLHIVANLFTMIKFFFSGHGNAIWRAKLDAAKGIGLMIRKRKEIQQNRAFLDVGGFDEDYFSYQEDVDLGFRLRLQGLRCFFVPQAVVHHVGSASTGKHSDFAIYHGHRNLVWTYVKNMPAPLFWVFLPLHLVANLFTMIKFFLTGHGNAIWRAKLDAAKGIGLMIRKRRKIQQNRQVTVAAIYRVINHNLFAPLAASLLRRHYGTDRE